MVEEQAAQLAELHNNLMEQRSVKISNVNSSKWEEVRAFSMLEVRVWDKPIQPNHMLKTADKTPVFGWTGNLEKTQADRYGPPAMHFNST